MHTDDAVVARSRCPACEEAGADTSGDNLAEYSDGHVHCFACGYHRNGGGTTPTPDKPVDNAVGFRRLSGRVESLDARCISENTCRKFSYEVARDKTLGYVELATYYRNGKPHGQKVRIRNPKSFRCVGDMRSPGLFGQHLWPEGGKILTVTEGEIDCLSISEVYDNRWPVVSVPTGAQGAAKVFKQELSYLNSFDEVRICFDNDDPGKEAAVECAALLTPGRAKIVHLSRKDANEYLVAGERKALSDALWQGEVYRPDGILHAKDVKVTDGGVEEVWTYPWDQLTRSLYGRRSGEVVMHASGSGMGKSTVMRELIWYDLQNKETVGVMMLEESVQDTLHDLMSLHLNKPVRKIMAARKINEALAKSGRDPIEFGVMDTLTDEEYDQAYQDLCNKGLYLYDHFGSLDSETLIHKLDHMVTGMGCRKIVLDHVSIVVSGMESGNERKDIDVLMTKLRQFVERTGAHLDAVCHLIKPQSKPFEEGGQISLRDFRGSGALYQLSDACIGYERNQQHPDKLVANTIAVRSLKDRFAGVTGIVGALRFDLESGRLNQIDYQLNDDGTVTFDPQGVNINYDELFPTTEDGTTDLEIT